MVSAVTLAWLIPNVVLRAEIYHSWCKKFFKDEYPKKRTAIIPFIDLGNVVNAFLSILQYGGF